MSVINTKLESKEIMVKKEFEENRISNNSTESNIEKQESNIENEAVETEKTIEDDKQAKESEENNVNEDDEFDEKGQNVVHSLIKEALKKYKKAGQSDDEDNSLPEESLSEATSKLHDINIRKGDKNSLVKKKCHTLAVSLRYGKYNRRTKFRKKLHQEARNPKKKSPKKKNISKKSQSSIAEVISSEQEIDTFKKGKRGYIGGKAKGRYIEEENEEKNDSEEDDDNFYFYRVSLGHFQQLQDNSGASTSNQCDKDYSGILSLLTSENSQNESSEELELLELQKWGNSSMLTSHEFLEKIKKMDPFENTSHQKLNYDRLSRVLTDISESGEDEGVLTKFNPQKQVEIISKTLQKSDVFSEREISIFGDVNYKWIQEFDCISAEVTCPLPVSNSGHLSVKSTPFSLEIHIRLTNEGEWVPFLIGYLAGQIHPEKSFWCFTSVCTILIYLKKALQGPWSYFLISRKTQFERMFEDQITDLMEVQQSAVVDLMSTFNSTELVQSHSDLMNKPIKSQEMGLANLNETEVDHVRFESNFLGDLANIESFDKNFKKIQAEKSTEGCDEEANKTSIKKGG